MIKVFGITNCSTVKKARLWLEDKKIDYVFHDFKKSGVPDCLDDWIQKLGWELLLNRKGTTWRKLSPEEQNQVKDAASAKAVMLENPSVIKRPVVVRDGQAILIGFDEQAWSEVLLI